MLWELEHVIAKKKSQAERVEEVFVIMLHRRLVFVLFFLTARPLFSQEPDPRSVPLAAENPVYLDVEAGLDDRVADLIRRMTLEEKAIALNHNGPDLERFGLRGDKWNQCLNGVQWDRPTTLFPSCIAMAATWDTDLIQHEVAQALSDEARAIYNLWRQNPRIRSQHKGLIYRDPVINIGRNPYWGRNHEAWGEDPYLTGSMAVAYVRGIQGDDPKYLKLAATLKHYAVNNVETNRFRLDAKVSRQMLYEYWLPHFRVAVVDGSACSLMASYNAINGTPNNINHWLLTEVLKNEWGHQGFVVSDLGGVQTMVEGHERNQLSYVDAVAKSLMAGCDFSGREYQRYIPQAVREEKLTEQRLDDALARVLRVRFRLGEFDPPESVPYSKISPDVIASPAHRAIALKAAHESIVLLQNRQAMLPLDKTRLRRVAVIGPLADRVVLNNYNGRHINLVTPLQAITRQLGDATEVVYSPGVGITKRDDGVGTRVDREEGFSRGASLKLEATAEGDFIEFPIRITAAGTYSFALRFKTFPSRGRFQLSIDAADLGEPIDMYESNGRYGRTARFGERQLAEGLHRVRFTALGRNENSQGFTGHFDQLTLRGPSDLQVELERSEFITGRKAASADPIGDAADLASGADVALLFVGTDQSVEQEGRDRRSLGLPGDQLKMVQAVVAAQPRTVVVLKSAGPLTVAWVKQNVPAVLQAWWGGEEGGTAVTDVLLGKISPAGRLPHTVYASEAQVPPLDQYDIDAGFTYMYLRGEPLYPFGHGLSYTAFDYSSLRISAETLNQDDALAVSVTVKNAGDIASDEIVQLYVKKVAPRSVWPKLKLCGFQRIHLEPAETKVVEFTLPASQLSRYDETVGTFVVKSGQYEILIGRSSSDIRERGRFEIASRETESQQRQGLRTGPR